MQGTETCVPRHPGTQQLLQTAVQDGRAVVFTMGSQASLTIIGDLRNKNSQTLPQSY
jgi:hypothetical protein